MKFYPFLVFLFSISCNLSVKSTSPEDTEESKVTIEAVMNNWHKAAANADLENYMDAMDEDAIYIGTDATENWTKTEFEKFCKPYFEKKTTWDFTTLQRNIFVSFNNNIAWFDELLKTQMGVCRGSGVLENYGESWKIKHYVLSMTIPNDTSNAVTNLKKDFDEKFMNKFIPTKQ